MKPILNIAGGVALILFGALYLRKALDRLFGARLEAWINQAAGNRLRALLSGLGISLLAPSSTTMAALALHAIQSRQATTRQMLAMIFGACIGLTATIQLVALSLTPYAPIIVLAGFVIAQAGRKPRTRQAGRMILGLGFIFLGVLTIQTQLAPGSSAYAGLLQGLALAGRHLWSMILAACLLSMTMQSATATLALMMAFAASQPISAAHLAAWVVGANLGIGLTILIGGWGRTASRQLGWGLVLAQGVAAALALEYSEYLEWGLAALPGGRAHYIANLHTSFNLLAALLGLPLVNPLCALAVRLAPERPGGPDSRYAACHVCRRPPESLALAVAQVRLEIAHYGRLVREHLAEAWKGVVSLDDQATEEVRGNRLPMERLSAEIQAFLASLTVGEGNQRREFSEPFTLARMLAELEIIQNTIGNQLTHCARDLQLLEVPFSPEGRAELDGYFQRVAAAFDLVLAALQDHAPAAAREVLEQNRQAGQLANDLRDRHLARLQQRVPGAFEISPQHLDAIHILRDIHNHLSHLVAAMNEPGAESRGAPRLA